jgi:hypothetical protein
MAATRPAAVELLALVGASRASIQVKLALARIAPAAVSSALLALAGRVTGVGLVELALARITMAPPSGNRTGGARTSSSAIAAARLIGATSGRGRGHEDGEPVPRGYRRPTCRHVGTGTRRLISSAIARRISFA